MAKLTIRNATEVARITCERTSSDGSTVRSIWVVRSDRKVLRRLTGDLSTGYSVAATVKVGVPQTQETLARIAERRGWKVVG